MPRSYNPWTWLPCSGAQGPILPHGKDLGSGSYNHSDIEQNYWGDSDQGHRHSDFTLIAENHRPHSATDVWDLYDIPSDPVPLNPCYYPLIIIAVLCAGLSAFMGSFDFLAFISSTITYLSSNLAGNLTYMSVNDLIASNAKYFFMTGAMLSSLVNALTKYDGFSELLESHGNQEDKQRIYKFYAVLAIYAALASAILALEGVEVAFYLLTTLCGILPKLVSLFFSALNLLSTSPQNYTGILNFKKQAIELRDELLNVLNDTETNKTQKATFFIKKAISITVLIVLAVFSVMGRVDKCIQFTIGLQNMSLRGNGDACQNINNELYESESYSSYNSYYGESSSDTSSTIIYWLLWSFGLGLGISTNTITALLLIAKASGPLSQAIKSVINAVNAVFTSKNWTLKKLAALTGYVFSLDFFTTMIGILVTVTLTFFYAINYPGYTLTTVSKLFAEKAWGDIIAWLSAVLAGILPAVYGYTSTDKHCTKKAGRYAQEKATSLYTNAIQPVANKAYNVYDGYIKPGISQLLDYIMNLLRAIGEHLNWEALLQQIGPAVQACASILQGCYNTRSEYSPISDYVPPV